MFFLWVSIIIFIFELNKSKQITMKSPRQLEKIYIRWSMRAAKHQEQVEMRKQGVITHSHGLTPEQTEFCKAVSDLCYKGHTAYDLLCQKYNVDKSKTPATVGLWVEITGLSEEALRAEVNKLSNEARRKIDSNYEKHRVALNEAYPKPVFDPAID